LGVSYTDIDVSRDSNAAREMVNLTGQMGVPVIVINGNVVVGFDRERIKMLLAAGSKIHFGLKIADASRLSAQQGTAPVSGALVGEVIPGAIGERAGLKPGDIITGINGQTINTASDLEGALENLQAGSVMTVLFSRNGESRKSEIVV
jgi:predicted metalloprotease with PDZ domain